MSTEYVIFSGNSRYATDFQAIIDRSVAIASLPLTQLTNTRTTLTDESAALSALDTKFASLQTAIQSLETATGINSYTTSVSNGAIVKATVSTGATEGSYSIEVTSLGSYTTTMSKDGLTAVTDPASQSISSATSFTLTVNGTGYTITPADGSLNALVAAINAKTEANVQASVVNIGTSSAPNYRLSIQGKKLGADVIQLNDGAMDLLDTLATGAQATYKVNGLATPIASDSRTIQLAPGLTVELLAPSSPGDVTTIAVSRTAAGIKDALAAFVNAYNAALDELDKHRGDTKGALAGDSIVYSLSQTLRNVGSYSEASGDITSLAELGLRYNEKGKLSLDAAAFDGATAGKFTALLNFLGASSGSGFLKQASDALDSVEQSDTAVLKAAIGSVQEGITRQDQLIAASQERVDLLRESLEAQMAAADALIAALEQQARYMNDLFESIRIARESFQ